MKGENMNLQRLFTDMDSANVAWEKLCALLKQGEYDFQRDRPGLQGQSMDVFARRLTYVLGVLLSLTPKGDDDLNVVVLGARTSQMREHLQFFQRHAEAVLSQISGGWAEGRKIRDGNDAFLIQIVEAENVIQQHDCNGSFAEMHGALSQLTMIVGALLPLCRASSAGDFEDSLRALADVQRQAAKMMSKLASDRKAVDSVVDSVAQMEKEVREAHVQAQTLVTTLRELQLGASSDVSNVVGLVERIRTTGEDAEKLSALVVGYQGKFEAFQAELESRNQAFQEHERTATSVSKSNQSNATEIERLTKLAESMIAGANTVGIAVSMEEARKRYAGRMVGAAVGFVVSIVLLAFSALPLAAHLVPGLFGTLIAVSPDNGNTPWYSVVGKLLLLAPVTWLTGFFTKTFADYFHLEREYAHKAAIAKAVEGFRRQAPKYEQEITAEVFLEVRTNPAHGKGAEPVAHPVYDFLTKALGKVLDKKIDEKG
jgi:CII-binding regulator of phage lambda lysogenization HflD